GRERLAPDAGGRVDRPGDAHRPGGTEAGEPLVVGLGVRARVGRPGRHLRAERRLRPWPRRVRGALVADGAGVPGVGGSHAVGPHERGPGESPLADPSGAAGAAAFVQGGRRPPSARRYPRRPMRIAVLGAGAMGSTAAVLLARHDDVDLLVLDVDAAGAGKVAAQIGRGEAGQADITGGLATDLKASGAEAVAACIPYRLNIPVMEACLEAGCHYADLGGLFHTTLKQLELHARF